MFAQSTSTSPSRGPSVVAPGRGVSLPALPPVDWQSEWASEVTATAMAVSALVLSEQHGGELSERNVHASSDSAYQGDLSELLVGSLHWLARRQQPDGGWSPDNSLPSMPATTMLVRATFGLTGLPVAYPNMADSMRSYIQSSGEYDGLKARYGAESTAVKVVVGVTALADIIDWNRLPPLPIETAMLDDAPSRATFWKGYGESLPAMLALGLASHKLRKPFNPLTNWRRSRATPRVMDYLRREQQPNGSYSNSVAVTSLVVMSLASAGLTTSQVVRRGVEYLFSSVQGDSSWPGDAKASPE